MQQGSPAAIVSFLATFVVLMLGWELIIRANWNPATAEVVSHPPADPGLVDPSREWLAFGNCLVLNGISPGVFHEVWQEKRPGSLTPRFRNVAEHEYAPQAYMAYLRQNDYYPELLIFNVSSWLNSDNFESDAEILDKQDLLGLRGAGESAKVDVLAGDQLNAEAATFQRSIESRLQGLLASGLRMSEKHYHLFDFGMFLRSLGTTLDLDKSLYQLNIQSWYTLRAQHTDGHGQMAFEVGYQPGWQRANRIMVERQLSRMRLGNFLTESFWSSLRSEIEHFQAQGTRIVMLRMPEHPQIYSYNERTYQLSKKLRELGERATVPFLDLNSDVALLAKVQLYDGVHPDQQSSQQISRYIATWLAETQPSWIFGEPR